MIHRRECKPPRGNVIDKGLKVINCLFVGNEVPGAIVGTRRIPEDPRTLREAKKTLWTQNKLSYKCKKSQIAKNGFMGTALREPLSVRSETIWGGRARQCRDWNAARCCCF